MVIFFLLWCSYEEYFLMLQNVDTYFEQREFCIIPLAENFPCFAPPLIFVLASFAVIYFNFFSSLSMHLLSLPLSVSKYQWYIVLVNSQSLSLFHCFCCLVWLIHFWLIKFVKDFYFQIKFIVLQWTTGIPLLYPSSVFPHPPLICWILLEWTIVLERTT